MKKFIAAALAALMLSSFAGCANTAEEPKNETYIYGQVDSVSGNDIVLLLAEYNGEDTSGEDTDSSEDGEGGKESDDSGSEKSKRSGRPGSGEKPEGFTRPENGEMPEGFDPSKFGGEMPEGFDPSKFGGEKPERSSKREKSSGESTESGEKAESGENSKSGEKSGDGDTSDSSSKREKRERPEGFTKPENGEMPEGFDPSNLSGEMPEGSGSKRSSKSGGSSSKFTLTGEQEELRIPVGTTVTTSLGVETDFKVIEAGNMIRCSVEKNSDGEDVITAVMIMEN